MMTGSAAAVAASQTAERAQNHAAREFDSLLAMQHDQLGAFTGLMRRVEDLSDRLLGSMPSSPETSAGTQPQRAGQFGSLLDIHEARDAVGVRLNDALMRIERVL